MRYVAWSWPWGPLPQDMKMDRTQLENLFKSFFDSDLMDWIYHAEARGQHYAASNMVVVGSSRLRHNFAIPLVVVRWVSSTVDFQHFTLALGFGFHRVLLGIELRRLESIVVLA
eukprot:751805-Amphidinium_carterae.1